MSVICTHYHVELTRCPKCEAHERGERPYQFFWRCAHHPSAIDNFFSETRSCGWGCHLAELKWHHNGVSPTPRGVGSVYVRVPYQYLNKNNNL
jgi:hypothetical protein